MLTIDRFEEGIAVCFDQEGRELHLLRAELPPEAAEGDVLLPQDSGWTLAHDYAEAKKQQLRERLARLAGTKEQP